MARKDPGRPQAGQANHAPHRSLDAKSLEQIGNSLKAHYEDLVQAPTPKKFLDLLDQLEAKEGAPTSDGQDDKRK
jgi:hypothetical protein